MTSDLHIELFLQELEKNDELQHALNDDEMAYHGGDVECWGLDDELPF